MALQGCKVNEFQGEIFASTLQRTNGIWYAYTYIIGNSEKAEKFKVKICVGKQNVAGMFGQGNVFPIDAKKADILKANHSVLSFPQMGMAEEFFLQKPLFPEVAIIVIFHNIKYEIFKLSLIIFGSVTVNIPIGWLLIYDNIFNKHLRF